MRKPPYTPRICYEKGLLFVIDCRATRRYLCRMTVKPGNRILTDFNFSPDFFEAIGGVKNGVDDKKPLAGSGE